MISIFIQLVVRYSHKTSRAMAMYPKYKRPIQLWTKLLFLDFFETIRISAVYAVHWYPKNKNKNNQKELKLKTSRSWQCYEKMCLSCDYYSKFGCYDFWQTKYIKSSALCQLTIMVHIMHSHFVDTPTSWILFLDVF